MTRSSTSTFRFKRFTIRQERAAMKVGFDGILLGAWADATNCQRILDVGTGTGLVALMLAQRTEVTPNVSIDAVEIDSAAAEESRHNVVESPWSDRVRVIEGVFPNEIHNHSKYDLIVSNPPWFAGGASSGSRARARSNETLPLQTLIESSYRLLTDCGRLSIVLPVDLEGSTICAAQQVGFVTRRVLRVRPLPEKDVHRVLLQFDRTSDPLPCIEESLTIELRHHEYTEEFRALAKDFYLAFVA